MRPRERLSPPSQNGHDTPFEIEILEQLGSGIRPQHQILCVQVWAEAVPEAPEPQGCAASLEKTDVQQEQSGRPGHSGQPKSKAPQSQHEEQPGRESASTEPQSPTRELARDKSADESEAAAAAPHPLLSVARPVSQTPEPASSASSASLHPLMQVLAGPHVHPAPELAFP